MDKDALAGVIAYLVAGLVNKIAKSRGWRIRSQAIVPVSVATGMVSAYAIAAAVGGGNWHSVVSGAISGLAATGANQLWRKSVVQERDPTAPGDA